MSIESRIRAGLTSSTEDLVSDVGVERELATVLRRARRRGRARVVGLGLAVVSLLAAAAWVASAPGRDDTDGPPEPVVPPTEVAPRSMEGVNGPLEAGTWVMPMFGADYTSLPRAVVEVPDGYGSPGGWAVDRGADGDPEEYGDVTFWSVDTVADKPCPDTFGTGPGPTVADLVQALRHQPGHLTTRPRPVTVDGYDGLYLEITFPGTNRIASCPSRMYTLWYSGGLPIHSEVPRTIAHLWILDLDGTRIVMAAGTTPDNTPAETTEVLDIARSVHFLPPSAPASP